MRPDRIFAPVALWAAIALATDPVVTLPAHARSMDLSAAEGIAVLSGGRVKPLLVAATEGVQEIRGRGGFARDFPPLNSWFSLALFPDSMAHQKVILCANKPLRSAIGLDPAGQFASFFELVGNLPLRRLVDRATAKERAHERPDALESAALDVSRRLDRFAEATSASGWRLMSGPKGKEGSWRLPQEVSPLEEAVDPALARRMGAFGRMIQSFQVGDQPGFDRAATELSRNGILSDSLSAMGDGTFLRTRAAHLRAELVLVKFRPFRAAWILLLVSFLCAWTASSAAGRSPRVERAADRTAAIAAIAALSALVAGFSLRAFVAGRPPVTDMYETALWAGFGATLLGTVLSLVRRSRTVLACASTAGCVAFLLADSLPTVLDPSIRPLVPVLRNNFWLTLHVLTVTFSYAAFLVAMALGNAGILQESRSGCGRERTGTLAHYAYRSMQLGTLFLTAGIVLGGIWADSSWGRFWGWDPKETWALIADLGYICVLHGRFSGRLRSFGTLMGAVLGFFGVVMAWYGVNFILASGLHSYGFSRGGALGVAVFVVLQGGYAAACALRRRRNLSQPDKAP